MMKAFIFNTVIIALLFGVANNLWAHVELDYPQGGETFTGGETVTIQWHITIQHNQLNWDLYFSANAGDTWSVIQADIPTEEMSYVWNVPAVVTSQARVRVIQDNAGMDYQDVSPDFTIVLAPMAPEIDIPARDTIFECDAVNLSEDIQQWLDNHGGAVAIGFCGDLVWTHDFTMLSDGCGTAGSAQVTFTASDSCGSNSTQAMLMVIDTTGPEMSLHATDAYAECNGSGNAAELMTWLTNHGGATATEACGNVVWTNNFSTLNDGCGTTGFAAVVFTATDDCGNSSTTAATFTIEDNIAPVIETEARDTTVECGGSNQEMVIQNWLDYQGGADASDVCGNFFWTNDFPVLPDTCMTTINLNVTFTVADACGNSNTSGAIFTLTGPSGTHAQDFSYFNYRISPNPARDILVIDFDVTESLLADFTLFDAWGRPVWIYHEKSKRVSIPVHGYVPGVYVLQIATSDGVYARKVIIE